MRNVTSLLNSGYWSFVPRARGIAIALCLIAASGCLEKKTSLVPAVPPFDSVPDLTASTLAASALLVVANGVSAVSLTVTLFNRSGLGIPGRSVLLISSRPLDDAISAQSGATDENGHYTFTASSALIGTSVYTAVDTALNRTLPGTATVAYVASGPSAQDSVLSATAESLAVASTSTIQLEVRDATGNPLGVGGSVVTFALSNGAAGTLTSVSDNGNDTYTAVFTAVASGSTTVTATIDGTAVPTTLALTVQ